MTERAKNKKSALATGSGEEWGEIVRRLPTLEARVEQSSRLEFVRKRDLQCGDWVLVTTRNSIYAICVLGDGLYSVSGGWFDRHGMSPLKITINGCTWGGSAIKHDVVAACGLFLEFGNHVMTTRIQKVRVIPAEARQIID